ncbi:hypothetical protein T12_8544 [Trichinella patagoniensis]|uniref:Uncharacterized protein n=1 Tax=Trichinella patagoniensis TaxID=990121 RepID=A0A0V0ZRW0_9BILA|nr:hypothetical protein T12_8544 [Trichinella patagoniensis]
MVSVESRLNFVCPACIVAKCCLFCELIIINNNAFSIHFNTVELLAPQVENKFHLYLSDTIYTGIQEKKKQIEMYCTTRNICLGNDSEKTD